MIHWTSDWHCFHEQVMVYDNRPFTDIEHMHRVLINNFNSCVSTHDTTYFLGDFGFGNIEQLRSVVTQLNGLKVIVLGNHDRKAAAMMKCGFNVAVNMASIVVAGKLVTMTHCPLRGVFREDVTGMRGAQEGDNWHGESRLLNYSIADFGQFHLHGHTHKGPEEKQTDRQWDVGVRANGYRPINIKQVESWIAKHK